jgi:small-conductance mechanosensitive channel
MEIVLGWSEPLIAALTRLVHQFFEFLPQLLGGIVLVVVGYFVAKLLRLIAVRLARGWDRLILRFAFGGKAADPEKASQSSVKWVGSAVFWVTILVFLMAAANTLDLRMVTAGLERIFGYVPNLIVAALTLVVGFALGNMARNAVAAALRSGTPQQRELLPAGAKILTVGITGVIAAGQVGIDNTVLVTILTVIVGAALAGAALAFGLGARTLVSNLIGSRDMRRDCRVGEVVRIGSAEGKILQLGQTSAVLETEEGRLTVPGKLYHEQACLVVERTEDHA